MRYQDIKILEQLAAKLAEYQEWVETSNYALPEFEHIEIHVGRKARDYNRDIDVATAKIPNSLIRGLLKTECLRLKDEMRKLGVEFPGDNNEQL